jgi:PKD repeat protein
MKAQQGNVWYFGNFAGLTFNTTPPSALADGQLNSLEGTSVMCDENGDVLFYTNGRTVFNRNHDLMLNGANLKGHPSTYQSSIIIPKPGSTTIYYIFTADAWENSGAEGYRYSEVDMTLDGGLGGITTNKNVYLSGPSSERLTAIRAADANSYWVITNEWGSNTFRSFKVDCNGVNTTPVLSSLGKVMDEDSYCNIGAMRISPDAKMIIQTNVKGRTQITPTNEYAQLFDFDYVTGRLSNARLMPLTNDGYYFGAEFSPDSKLLYIVNTFKATVHQFDVSSGDLNTIMASKTILPGANEMAGIALGPDQKIYLTSGQASLHVINQPKVAGPGCDLVLRQVTLTSGGKLALPNIVPNLYVNKPVDFTYQLLGNCGGGVQFTGIAQIPGVTLNWDFGDGNTGTGASPLHTYGNPNNEYTVKLTAINTGGCVYEVVSKKVRPSGEQVLANFGLAAQCDAALVKFTDSSEAGSGQINYRWEFGDGNVSNVPNPTHQYASNRMYNVRLIVSSSNGCVADTMDRVVDISQPVVNAGPDIDVTTIDPIQLNATGATRYEWKPSTYLDNPNIANPMMKAWDAITYVVKGYNATGCSDTDTLEVTIKTLPVITVPNAFRPGGRNPVLRPILRMAKGLNYFQVYNRWGQMVFSTKTIGDGWDGTYKGLPQASGTYVWVLEAVDAEGKIVRQRGSSILIR